MQRFEPGITGLRGNWSTNCSTTTAQYNCIFCLKRHKIYEKRPGEARREKLPGPFWWPPSEWLSAWDTAENWPSSPWSPLTSASPSAAGSSRKRSSACSSGSWSTCKARSRIKRQTTAMSHCPSPERERQKKQNLVQRDQKSMLQYFFGKISKF